MYKRQLRHELARAAETTRATPTETAALRTADTSRPPVEAPAQVPDEDLEDEGDAAPDAADQNTLARLADALFAAGDLPGALEAFRSALAAAELAGEPEAMARARHGMGRCLELLGREDEALTAYTAVEAVQGGGPWVSAARFARGFIAWRRSLGPTASPKASRPGAR